VSAAATRPHRDRVPRAGVRPVAAQLSYVAPADVSAPSRRRSAFLPGAVVAALLLAVPAVAGPGGTRAGPVLAGAPTIAGEATQGSVLVATPGSWQGSGTIRYVYRWYRCDAMGRGCKLLRGAAAPRHKLVAGDVGHTLALNVRASDPAGSTNGYASLIGPIAWSRPPLVSVAQPSVAGTPTVGASVQVDPGKWSPAPKSFAYQWLRCNANGRGCAPIAGDTAAAHTVVPRDVAHALVAIVQAKSASTALAVLSRATPRVGGTAPAPPAPPGPTSSARPTVTGYAQQGKQLTAAPGTWSGTGTIQYAYQWYRCDPAGAHCMSIHGATKPTYTEVQKDVGSTIGLTVRATDTKGTTSAYAGLVGPVAAPASPIYTTAQPTISGTPTAGQTLQVSAGTWSQPPTAYAYQWQRCNANGRVCTAVTGATGAAYVVTAADAGHALVAVVTATAGASTQASLSTVAP
jgi:hypothetical protein